jgi:hypothetical protein
VCAQKLPVIPPIIKKPIKTVVNNNSIETKVELFTSDDTQPQTFIEAGKAIITVTTKNKTLALLSIPTKYIW